MKSRSEEFCKDGFDRYLKKITSTATISWENVEQRHEPPDFYLFVDGTKYAVEVTILMRKEDVGAQNPLPVGIVSHLLDKFVTDEIESVARQEGYLQGSYLVSFFKPVTNFAKIKRMIQSEILSYISTTQSLIKAPPKVVYECNRQKCTIRKVHDRENKVIMGGPIISRWEKEALMEAQQLIDNRLDEKQHRLRNIAYPKILLLHDKYYFMNIEDYKACILKESSLRSFHTVFIVENKNEGTVLYSQESAWRVSL